MLKIIAELRVTITQFLGYQITDSSVNKHREHCYQSADGNEGHSHPVFPSIRAEKVENTATPSKEQKAHKEHACGVKKVSSRYGKPADAAYYRQNITDYRCSYAERILSKSSPKAP